MVSMLTTEQSMGGQYLAKVILIVNLSGMDKHIDE